MLSRPVSRAAHTPNSFVVSSACLKPSTAAPLASPNRPHHRRSSSKTSHPPGSGPPTARGSAQAESGNSNSSKDSSSSDQVSEKRRVNANNPSKRRSRSYPTTAEAIVQKARSDALLNIPAVQPTSHLNLSDVKLSSLFALHRPISINPTAAYPPTTTNKSFNALFNAPKTSKISNEIFTMAPQSSSPSAYQNEEADGLHFSVLQSSSSNASPSADAIHVDAPVNLDQISRRFRPFQIPPAPVPMGDRSRPQTAQPSELKPGPDVAAPQFEEASEMTGKPSEGERTYTTTLTIREATNAAGDKTYTASASPIIEHRDAPTASRSTAVQATRARQPFLERMHARGLSIDKDRQERVENVSRRWEAETNVDSEDADGVQSGLAGDDVAHDFGKEMLLISVKRQRKLKMKKHKYKKLMRRTRNLRRREGRL